MSIENFKKKDRDNIIRKENSRLLKDNSKKGDLELLLFQIIDTLKLMWKQFDYDTKLKFFGSLPPKDQLSVIKESMKLNQAQDLP